MIITTYDFVGGGGGQLKIAYANTQHSVTLVQTCTHLPIGKDANIF